MGGLVKIQWLQELDGWNKLEWRESDIFIGERRFQIFFFVFTCRLGSESPPLQIK